ncbi:MAG: glutathione peroxidase [Rhizobiaceae bacterium]|nr:glutathione peroxidase [Rhizobiaceae bacterium]
MDGTTGSLGDYAGKVLLVVNTASKCGLTPQYEALEALYRARKDEGLEILGFPANDFMGQEPGSDAEIASFCQLTYDVTFPVFSKISVKGADAHPLYRQLTAAHPAKAGAEEFLKRMAESGLAPERPEDVLWNFEKFLVSRKGEVIGRYSPSMKPDDAMLAGDIDRALAESA